MANLAGAPPPPRFALRVPIEAAADGVASSRPVVAEAVTGSRPGPAELVVRVSP